jgi:hypothetical protein
MDNADKVAQSPARAFIEEQVLAGKTNEEIVSDAAAARGEVFSCEEVEAYREKYLKTGQGLCHEVIEASRNLGRAELPATNDIDTLSSFFSFKRTNDDLELIYSRIRELTELSRQYPDIDSYDKRIAEYLKRAESIRERIFKGQFEDLRKSILMNAGKKLVVAAITVLMPYVQYNKREEAKKLFLDAIAPILNVEVPMEPEDIAGARERLNGK